MSGFKEKQSNLMMMMMIHINTIMMTEMMRVDEMIMICIDGRDWDRASEDDRTPT